MSEISTSSTGPVKKKKLVRKNKAPLRILIFLVFVLVTVVSSVYSYKYVVEQNTLKAEKTLPQIPEDKRIEFVVESGSVTETISKKLEAQGIIKYPMIFKLMSKINGYDGKYRAGTHYLSDELDYEQIMMVLAGEPERIWITFMEGLTANDTMGKLLEKKLIDRNKFLQVMNTEKFDYKFLEGLPKRELRFEGYLFPDTYDFDMKDGEKEIINKLLKNFGDKFKPEYYKKAQEMKMTVDQIVILASIIEKEAATAEDRKTIAGVFYNRLKSKDKTLRKLQSCATIQYIIYNKEGVYKKVISEKDTKIPSPYNTYENEGLPPGPICSPGQAAIEAALYPEKTDYLYFVARGDGTHQFSKTYKEHQAATKKYGVN